MTEPTKGLRLEFTPGMLGLHFVGEAPYVEENGPTDMAYVNRLIEEDEKRRCAQRTSEGTLTITRDVTTVSPNFKVTAMTVSDVTRGPCPLCGRTDNHTHAAGPFGMS